MLSILGCSLYYFPALHSALVSLSRTVVSAGMNAFSFVYPSVFRQATLELILTGSWITAGIFIV